MRKWTNIIFCLSTMFLIACEKEELPVDSPQPGALLTTQIEMGYPYQYQVYYNCETNKVVSSNSRYDWDLSFQSFSDLCHIKLNTAKGMFAANTQTDDFESVMSEENLEWLWDSSTGNLDSTAIGDWGFASNFHPVYVIDRQYNSNGDYLGLWKIQFTSCDDNEYTFRYAKLDGSEENTFSLDKDSQTNFSHFTFNNGGEQLWLEPSTDNWDLVFTNYQHFFTNLPLPFVITGALSNTYNGVRIAEDNDGLFFEIELKDTINYSFTNLQDEIGYDWKIRNSQDNSFTIDPDKSFIIRTSSGLFYKIRFIDFYNDEGDKGYPKFEIQKL